MNKYEIVSVSGGKFHRPEITLFDGGSSDIRNPRLMRCGRSLVPLNCFETIADANRYCGQRLEKHICQQCERSVSHLWRVPTVLENGNPVQHSVSEGEMNHANLRELCERFVLLHGNGNTEPDVWAFTVNLANAEIARAKQLGIEGSYANKAAC